MRSSNVKRKFGVLVEKWIEFGVSEHSFSKLTYTGK